MRFGLNETRGVERSRQDDLAVPTIRASPLSRVSCTVAAVAAME